MCNEAVTYRCGACWTSIPLLFAAAAAAAAAASQHGKPFADGEGEKIKACSPPAPRDLLPWRCVCVASRRSSACAQRRSARQPPVHSRFPSNDSVAPLKPQPPGDTCQVLLTASSSLKIQTCGPLSWRRRPGPLSVRRLRCQEAVCVFESWQTTRNPAKTTKAWRTL